MRGFISYITGEPCNIDDFQRLYEADEVDVTLQAGIVSYSICDWAHGYFLTVRPPHHPRLLAVMEGEIADCPVPLLLAIAFSFSPSDSVLLWSVRINLPCHHVR